MRYLVIIRPTRTGYSADSPDVPGCVAAARTVNGVRKLMAEALCLHLGAMRKSGDKIPKPRKRVQLDADDFEDDDICTWIEPKEIVSRTRQRRRTVAGASG